MSLRVTCMLSTLSGFGLGLVCTMVCIWRLLRCGFGVDVWALAIFCVVGLMWTWCGLCLRLVSIRSAPRLGSVWAHGLGLLYCGLGMDLLCA